MANAFLINLYFSPQNLNTATGLFDPDAPTGNRSKIWYKFPASAWAGSANPPAPGQLVAAPFTPPSGATIIPDKSPLGCNLQDLVFLRVVPSGGFNAQNLCQFGAAFGRTPNASAPPGGRALIASPFLLSAGPQPSLPCTTFAGQATGSAVNTGLTLYLGPLAQNHPNRAPGSGQYTYSFIVWLRVVASAIVVANYGHDPGMDVNG